MPRTKPAKNPRPRKKAAEAKPVPRAEAEGAEEGAPISSLKQMFDDAAKAESRPALRFVDVECPFCGEEFEITVDPQEEGQEMIQDCRACCHPITFSVEVEDGEVSVNAYRE